MLRTGGELDPDANRCLPPPGEGDERVAGQTQVGQVRWSGGQTQVGDKQSATQSVMISGNGTKDFVFHF